MPPKSERSRVSLRNIVTVGILVTSRAYVGAASSSSSSSSSSVLVPCPAESSIPLVVNDTASAQALAETVFCAGGVFHVEWDGDIVVDLPISISDGTCLNVTGVGSNAAMTGGGLDAFFVVSKGCLNVKNMQFIGGGSSYVIGGAIFASDSSMTFENTSFNGNAGFYGGALFILDSTASWQGVATFINNTAEAMGGGIFAEKSTLTWEGNTTFVDHSNSSFYGGALCLLDSTASWQGVATFVNNTAVARGGGIYAQDSMLTWEGKTTFVDNTAEQDGGAIHALNSTLTWEEETLFTHNVAGQYAGSAYISTGSQATWRAGALFADNTAHDGGGAVFIVDDWVGAGNGSSAVWEAEASFIRNRADNGGAVLVWGECNASWEGDTVFFNNSALESPLVFKMTRGAGYSGGDGGAVHVTLGSAFWGGKTNFSNNNAAGRGGALSSYGGTFRLNEAFFVNNDAETYGGAVSLESSSLVEVEIPSSLTIENTTEFNGNTCNTGGGGMSMFGLVSVIFAENKVSLSENSAVVAGGGVYVAGLATGPQFTGVKFTSNTAQSGGGVYATSSGTDHRTETYTGEKRTKFDRCDFVNNTAISTGGAVDSTLGQEAFFNSIFKGNTAGIGGALRLAGTDSSVSNCAFVENSSDEGEGPAVSNIGYISSLTNSSFISNVFECAEGTFLEINLEENNTAAFDVACDECDSTCTDCEFDSKVPSCIEQLVHSLSAGGDTTLETLSIDEGYWRATNTSTAVLACYNADACLGGITGGDGYCDDGYEGPYCSVCSDGYISTQDYVCNKCSNDSGRVVAVIVVGVLSLIAFVVFLSYMVSGEGDGEVKGIAARIAPYIPLQSLKVIIVAWQILTQFSEVANVTYPGVYQTFLDGVEVLNFDLSRVLSAGCIVDVGFHERLLMSTLAPLVGMAILGATNAVATRRNHGSESALRNVRHKHLSMVLLLTFVVYSSVSSTLFQTFGLDEVDDGVVYLRADYRIEYNSFRHRSFMVYAGFMLVLYTAGIPLFYAILLYKNREILVHGVGRESNPRIKSTTDLWKPYKPHRFYYEIVECARRILLAGAVVFIYPNTAAQVAATIMIAVFFIFVSEALAPYASKWDTWISRMGHGIVFMSMYVALLLKVDVSSENASSQEVFNVILVFAHACMVCVVVVESVATACSVFRKEKEDDIPRTRPFKLERVVPENEACQVRAGAAKGLSIPEEVKEV